MEHHFSDLLQKEFDQRRKNNAAYSLRSFSKQIGLSPSAVSQVLKKNAGLSKSKALAIASRLNWSLEDQSYFVTLVGSCCARKATQRKRAKMHLRRFDRNEIQVSLKNFQSVSDWYHFAIVELSSLQGFKSNVEWIAAKLGISVREAKLAVQRLISIGLLEETKGEWKPAKDFYAVPKGNASEVIQKFHRQILQKSIMAITEQELSERIFGTSVLKIRKKDLPELQQRLQNFRRDLGAWLESGEGHDSVYSLHLQAFNLVKD